MAIYTVTIVYDKGRDARGFKEYESESIYHGEDETMMRVKFFDAVRQAQASPDAVVVSVWRDVEQFVRVKIEH